MVIVQWYTVESIEKGQTMVSATDDNFAVPASSTAESGMFVGLINDEQGKAGNRQVVARALQNREVLNVKGLKLF